MRMVYYVFMLIFVFFIIGCSAKQDNDNIDIRKLEPNYISKGQQNQEVENMKLLSKSFQDNSPIPPKYTCDGEDINPGLLVKDVPKNAKSLALIMDDPDAPRGTFVHWVVWNINPSINEIKEGIEPDGLQGITGFARMGYGGPCPPSGTHRYFFKLYALDIKLDLVEGSSKEDLEDAMEGHILAEAQLMGTYKRK